MCQQHHLMRAQVFELMIAPYLTPVPRTWQTVPQTEHVACNGGAGRAMLRRLTTHVVAHLLFDLLARRHLHWPPLSCAKGRGAIGAGRKLTGTEERCIPGGEPPGVVIGSTTEHDAIESH